MRPSTITPEEMGELLKKGVARADKARKRLRRTFGPRNSFDTWKFLKKLEEFERMSRENNIMIGQEVEE